MVVPQFSNGTGKTDCGVPEEMVLPTGSRVCGSFSPEISPVRALTWKPTVDLPLQLSSYPAYKRATLTSSLLRTATTASMGSPASPRLLTFQIPSTCSSVPFTPVIPRFRFQIVLPVVESIATSFPDFVTATRSCWKPNSSLWRWSADKGVVEIVAEYDADVNRRTKRKT